MKITIEHEGQTVTVDDPDVVDIWDAKDLLRRAMHALGYHPKNIEEILPEEK